MISLEAKSVLPIAAWSDKKKSSSQKGKTHWSGKLPPGVSGAPSPVKPTGSSNIVSKDPEKMTMAEYEKWRQRGGGR